MTKRKLGNDNSAKNTAIDKKTHLTEKSVIEDKSKYTGETIIEKNKNLKDKVSDKECKFIEWT